MLPVRTHNQQAQLHRAAFVWVALLLPKPLRGGNRLADSAPTTCSLQKNASRAAPPLWTLPGPAGRCGCVLGGASYMSGPNCCAATHLLCLSLCKRTEGRMLNHASRGAPPAMQGPGGRCQASRCCRKRGVAAQPHISFFCTHQLHAGHSAGKERGVALISFGGCTQLAQPPAGRCHVSSFVHATLQEKRG